MKKIITLVLVAASFAASAQTTKDGNRDIILGSPKNSGGGGTSSGDRNVILGGGNKGSYPDTYPNTSSDAERINREYDIKIASIRNNPNLSRAEKDRMIRQLESDRAKRLKALRNQGGYGKNRGDDCHDNKGNKGKHKGWEKGKGNKHRS